MKTLAEKIIDELYKFYGVPEIPLNYKNIYELTIAVVLSAQTTDNQVNKVTPTLFKKYNCFEKLANAKIEDVEKIIKSTGFYKNKSKNIINLAKTIVNNFNAILPEDFNVLTALPGIGRKTANVIFNQGFKKNAIAVDTHVFRLANRLQFCNAKNVLETENALKEQLPEKKWGISHLLLITHGRQFCKARTPLCQNCPILNLCPYKDKCL